MCSQAGRLNIVMMSVLPKWICIYNAIPDKIPEHSFVDINRLILNSFGEVKDQQYLKRSTKSEK